jgi:peptide/nickel transport system substrate-binding protein
MPSFSMTHRSAFRRRAGKALAVAALVPVLALSACTQGTGSAGANSSSSASSGGGGSAISGGSTGTSGGSGSPVGDSITFGTSLAPPSLNPATGDPSYGGTLIWAYDPLLVTQPDGSIAAGLAQKWGYVGTGNKVFELTIRSNAKFSDGTAVDAKAVKTFLDYERTQKIGSEAALLVSVRSIEATGPLTVRINFKTPTPSFPTLIAQGLMASAIASPAAVANPSTLDKGTAGAGPYMLDSSQTVASDHYTFVPNPHYWDPSRQHYKKVTVKVISNPSSMVQAMRAGQIQAALGDPTTLAAARGAGLTVMAPPQAMTGLNLMDRAGTVSKPMGDVRVRQALNYAVDRKTIAKALYGNASLTLSQYALNGQPGYDASLEAKYPYDPAKAKQLLAAAGYPNGFDLAVVDTPLVGLSKVISAIGGQLKQVGVNLQVTTKANANDYFVAMVSTKFPAAAEGYGLANMATLYSGYVSPAGPFNPFKYIDKTLDSLYQAYNVAPEAQSASAQKAINDRLVDQAWSVPVVGSPLSYYTVKGIAGLEATSQNSGVPWLTEIRPAG